MSACPDNNSGYLDGKDEVSDQEPHEQRTDHRVTEVQEAVPQEENSIDGIPKKLMNVWETGRWRNVCTLRQGRRFGSVTFAMGCGLNGIIQRQWVMLLVVVGTSQAAR